MNNILNVNFKGKIPFLENNKKTPLNALSMNNSYDFKLGQLVTMGGVLQGTLQPRINEIK